MSFTLRELCLVVLLFSCGMYIAYQQPTINYEISKKDKEIEHLKAMLRESGSPIKIKGEGNHNVFIGFGIDTNRKATSVVIGNENIEYEVVRIGGIDLNQMVKEIKALKEVTLEKPK